MEEGRVARWLVKDGERVHAGQPIAEIETDKAMSEMEAPAAGIIRLIAKEGAVVTINSALAEILNDLPS
jgi:pyruvate/2-oxoglutarate dehydrogenase complex dihydrolipoamide acyltransferase (E2) component